MNTSASLPQPQDQTFEVSGLNRRQTVASIWKYIFMVAVGIACLALLVLLWRILSQGWDSLSWGLIRNMPSRKPEIAGMNSAIWGSIWVISLTIALALPIGIGSGIYLEEYAPRNKISRILRINIANLAGVPSVVYGMLGLGIFVQALDIGRVVLAGALTMALLSLPVIIIATQEAIRAVPWSLREAAYGVGATRWQVTWSHVLPAALPGILTGTILAISRAIGETAPLLVVGAAAYLAQRPSGFLDPYTAIPIQIFNWSTRPQAEFKNLAAAAIIVLILLLISMNMVAIVIRERSSRKARW